MNKSIIKIMAVAMGIALSAPSQAFELTEPTTLYAPHGFGNNIACGQDGDAILEAPDAATPTAEAPVESWSYMIDPGNQRQHFDGWGVSLCWWANVCGKWTDDKVDELVDWLVSPEGLNFRIFRYNIGGGDDPNNTNCTPHHNASGKGLRAEMEGFKDSSDGPYIWSRDEAQRKIMLKIKEKRPDAIFEAFSNSAPYYMTYSGCVGGNKDSSKDNLKPEYYEEFAHYLVDVCKHYKDEYGIEFRTLEPFNEPMTNYWGANGGQEGCHFDTASQIEFLKVLSPILKASGLNTVISACDETSVSRSVNEYIAYRSAGVLPLLGQWNVHTYSADNKSRTRLSALCGEDGMPLWMSEVGAGGNGIGGNLSLALKLIDDIRYIMPSAWIDWQYVEEGNDQWCLVKSDSFAEQNYHKVKNYYVRSHFSRYIKEGSTIETSLNDHTLAARSPEGDRLVLVAVNDRGAAVRHTVDLSSYSEVGSEIEAVVTDESRDMEAFSSYGYNVKEKTMTFELPPLSIATFVIPVRYEGSAQTEISEGVRYLLMPRNAADVAVAATGNEVKLTELSLDKSQIWTLSKSDSGYSLTNGEGNIITEVPDQYALKMSDEPGNGQTFMFKPVDRIFFRIMSADGTRALDLENEKTGAGTRVGMWNYSDGTAPTHRHWALIRVTDSMINGIEQIAASPADSSSEMPLILSSTEKGSLTVGCPDDLEGTVKILSSDGICAAAFEAGAGSRTVSLQSGIYIVSLFTGSSRYASVVLVK